MGTPPLRTKRGRLTAYALACGYTERHTCPVNGSKAEREVQLWLEPACGVYHVRAHCFATSKRLFWHSFKTVAEARACYDKAKRDLASL
jgi:hypothetical protein